MPAETKDESFRKKAAEYALEAVDQVLNAVPAVQAIDGLQALLFSSFVIAWMSGHCEATQQELSRLRIGLDRKDLHVN